MERGLDKLLHELELPLVRVLREMEKIGIKLDAARLQGSRAASRRRPKGVVRGLDSTLGMSSPVRPSPSLPTSLPSGIE